MVINRPYDKCVTAFRDLTRVISLRKDKHVARTIRCDTLLVALTVSLPADAQMTSQRLYR